MGTTCQATIQERPNFVLIAGDLRPRTTDTVQRQFFTEMRRHLSRMKDEPGTRVLLYLGNDDAHSLEPLLDELQPGGAWTALVNYTRWFQPGQVGRQLHYIRLEVAEGYELQNTRHSLFEKT